MMLIIFTLIMLLMGTAISVPEPAATCASGYFMCESNGAFNGFDDLVHLYQDLVDTVDASSHFKREALEAEFLPRKVTPTFLCCAEGMQCLALKGSNVPFCWDKFTTNVYLPGGPYGSITTGDFTFQSGEKVNLITGQYANGSNIYSADITARPNPATMSLPRQWTSKGVGSAIPASVLGASVTEIIPTSSSDVNPPSSSLSTTETKPGVTATSDSVVTTTTQSESTATSGSISATTTQPGSTVDSSTLSHSAQKTDTASSPAPTAAGAAGIKDSAYWAYALVTLIISMMLR
ncbi:hypothetical protein VTN77DRAFT_4714 [Rasamsonia byssochlamydoides]|uniref:uncharacterized protein n=1 Tax=Rasamsonia byssochlamydoides TaxID=89139 RepID=UPI003742A7F2